jgi:LysM repeat protein
MAGQSLRDLLAGLADQQFEVTSRPPGPEWGNFDGPGILNAMQRGKQTAQTMMTPRAPFIASAAKPGIESILTGLPPAANILAEARNAAPASINESIFDGVKAAASAGTGTIDDTVMRPASASTSGAFSTFQPGSAGWRAMAEQAASPSMSGVKVPVDPLSAATPKVSPSWNAPFGAGGFIQPRANLISALPERNAAREAFRAGGPSAVRAAADKTAPIALEDIMSGVASAAPAAESTVPTGNFLSRFAAGVAPFAKKFGLGAGALTAGSAIGYGASKMMGPWTGFLQPNTLDVDGPLPLDPARAAELEAQFHGANAVPAPSGFDLPSPEEMSLPEEQEAGPEPDVDEPPPVIPTQSPYDDLHTIKKGDTLSGLLLANGVSQEDLPREIGQIMRGNNINPNNITPGQVIDFSQRLAGPDYHYMPKQFGGAPSNAIHGGEIPASEPLGDIMSGLTSGAQLAPNYDAIMGPGQRPQSISRPFVSNPERLPPNRPRPLQRLPGPRTGRMPSM